MGVGYLPGLETWKQTFGETCLLLLVSLTEHWWLHFYFISLFSPSQFSYFYSSLYCSTNPIYHREATFNLMKHIVDPVASFPKTSGGYPGVLRWCPKPPKWHLGFCETYAALPLQSHSCPLSLSWLISQITISRILQPFGHISTSWNFQGLAQKSHCPWNFSSPPIKINIYHLSILIARRTTSL